MSTFFAGPQYTNADIEHVLQKMLHIPKSIISIIMCYITEKEYFMLNSIGINHRNQTLLISIYDTYYSKRIKISVNIYDPKNHLKTYFEYKYYTRKYNDDLDECLL
eukprot:361754_1